MAVGALERFSGSQRGVLFEEEVAQDGAVAAENITTVTWAGGQMHALRVWMSGSCEIGGRASVLVAAAFCASFEPVEMARASSA